MIKIPKYKCYRDESEDKASSKLFYKFAVILFVFYLFVIICSQCFHANFAYITISGKSMQNTLNPSPALVRSYYKGNTYSAWLQDGVYIRKLHKDQYNDLSRNVAYGDIVILKHDLSIQDNTIIKRALAFEKDYVTILKVPVGEKYEFRLFRLKYSGANVEMVYEPYIKSYQDWSGKTIVDNAVTVGGYYYERDLYNTFKNKGYEEATFTVNGIGENVIFFQIPEDTVFFLGDNRTGSTDSRNLGTYESNRVVGYVIDIVENGSKYQGNNTWWLNRTWAFIKLCWNEILRFFGANV